MTRRQPARWLFGLVLVAALAYGAYFSWLSLARHDNLLTNTADLGQIDLAVWNTLHGRFVQEVKGEQISTRLTDHVEPVFWPVSVVFGLWDDAGALLVLQAVMLALASLLIWGAVASWGPGRTSRTALVAATWAACTYLLAPQAQAATVADFHASPLAVVPLALFLLLGRRKRTLPALAAAAAALAIKEEIALVVAAAGLVLALTAHWKPGFAVAGAAVAWFLLAMLVIIPHYSADAYGEASMPYLARYEEATAGGAAESLADRAVALVERSLSADRLRYVGGLLAAFGFAPLLAPEVAVIAAPLVGANVLSQYGAMYSGEFHYSAPFMSILAVAAGLGALRLWRWARRRGKAAMASAVLLLVALPLGYQVAEGYTPVGAEYYLSRPTTDGRGSLVARFAAEIPDDASLSVTPALHPHFSHRQLIFTYPDVGGAEYVLLDVAGTTDMHPTDVREGFAALLERGYGVLDASDGMVLLRAGGGTEEPPATFYSFAHSSSQPTYSLDVSFGTTSRLVGYDWLDDAKWGYTSLRLYWQALGPVPDNVLPYAAFVDGFGSSVGDSRSAPFLEPLWLPLSQWPAGETMVTTTVAMPLGSAWGAYVGVAVDGNYDDPAARLVPSSAEGHAISATNLVRLAPVTRSRRWFSVALTPLIPTAPDGAVGGTLFDGWLRLEGATLPQSVGLDETLAVVTYWSRAAVPSADVALSLRLLDEQGGMVAQLDGSIQQGQYPASDWAQGETVPDAKRLRLPADLSPGEYSVALVVYDRFAGAALPADGGDRVILGSVKVAAGDGGP